MRRYLLALVVLMLLFVYLLYGTEQRVSLADFRKELNTTKKISIVMDTRYSDVRVPVMQCGTSIAWALGVTGRYDALKNRTFVYEGETCFYGNTNASISQCESMIAGSTLFYIRYNPSRNSTSFYKSKAVVEGDADFLKDCAIARMIS